MRAELQSFFQAYGHSFSEGPKAIAAFYAEPCVTARAGVVRVNLTSIDTQKLFADVDDQYRARGFTHGGMLSSEYKTLGANSALATIRWAYMDAANTTLWETTFSYNVYKQQGSLKILVQTMHD